MQYIAIVEKVAAAGLTLRMECDMMKRGDIYLASLDPVIGSEQGGVRPVLIVQNDMGNLHSPTVIVAAITTRHKKPRLPTHVPILASECGIRHDSVVLMEQVRTLEKTRLTKRLGSVPPETMRRVDAALRLSLGTDEKKNTGGYLYDPQKQQGELDENA